MSTGVPPGNANGGRATEGVRKAPTPPGQEPMKAASPAAPPMEDVFGPNTKLKGKSLAPAFAGSNTGLKQTKGGLFAPMPVMFLGLAVVGGIAYFQLNSSKKITPSDENASLLEAGKGPRT